LDQTTVTARWTHPERELVMTFDDSQDGAVCLCIKQQSQKIDALCELLLAPMMFPAVPPPASSRGV
jgi:hypothetical protein